MLFVSKEFTRWHGSVTKGADDTIVIKFDHKGDEENPHPGLPGVTWPPRPFSKPWQPEMRGVGDRRRPWLALLRNGNSIQCSVAAVRLDFGPRHIPSLVAA